MDNGSPNSGSPGNRRRARPRGKGRWCGLSPAMTTSVFVAQVASNTLITRFAAAVRRRLETVE
ncbi:Uncharacterised protein [Mycobacterium tuberculosis]|nr:Uncharacterised protein [Mycobacterium tuberculosis]